MGIGDYFNTAKSTLNPHNRGFGFFVYGTLPLFIVRFTGEIIGQTDYDALKLLGRQFSALADLGTIFLLYLIVARLYNRRTALLAAAFSAFAVMQIQQSHFFTTDLFVNLFAFLAIYFAVEIITRETNTEVDKLEIENRELETDHERDPISQIPNLQFRYHYQSSRAIPFSGSVSPSVSLSAWQWLPRSIFSRWHCFCRLRLSIRLIRNKAEREHFLTTGYWQLVIVYLIVGGIAAFLAFRIFQPYAFDGIMPSEQWLANIAEQRVQARGDADLPWNLQWARRTHLYSFTNLTVWGLGSAAGHPGLGRFPVYGLAHPQGRVETCPAVGLDGILFHLAIAAIQPDHALPACRSIPCWR